MSNNLPMAFSSWLPSGNDWRSYWKWPLKCREFSHE
jgi:hypothetical protein